MSVVAELVTPTLVYGADDQPGLRRRGRTRVRYVDDRTGEAVTDPDVLARIRRLAVPPAWTDVWISADPCSHLQATGRDAKGRKQYRYHPDFRAEREATKFDQLVPFGQALGAIRRRVDEHLGLPGHPYERVVALVVTLLERTFERVGNEEYARANGSYGLTTLRDQHVRADPRGLRLRFPGKHGIVRDVRLADPRLARIVRRVQDLPGQTLFQYEDDDGTLRPVRSGDVNDYLRAISGLDVTAKTYRTWGATLLAGAALAALEPPESATAARSSIAATVAAVARELGNTPAVCRRAYVHPVVLARYAEGDLGERWRAGPNRDAGGLTVDERRLLHLLDTAGGLAAAIAG